MAAADAGLPIPASPIAPRGLPCPPGWQSLSDDDGENCEPWIEDRDPTCEPPAARFPGALGCVVVGTPCQDDDDYASDLPETDVIFVDTDATAPLDGSRDHPFASVAEALVAASSHATIALARGTHLGPIALPDGISMVGACVAETTITSTAPTGSPALTLEGHDNHVRNLTVTGARPGIWVAASATAAVLEDVVIDGATHGGLTVLGELEARRLVVRNTLPGTGGKFGRGLHVEGGQLRLEDAVLSNNREVALSATGATASVTVRGLAVLDTAPQASDGLYGMGLLLFGGAHAEIRDAIFAGNHFVGVHAGQSGTHLLLEQVVVRDTDGQLADEKGGMGVLVGGGASMEMRRGLVERNRGTGVTVGQTGSELLLEDAIIRDQRPWRFNDQAGLGLRVEGGAFLEAARVVIARNLAAGLSVSDPGSRMRLEDVAIISTAGQVSDHRVGAGLIADLGAVVEASRLAVMANRFVGIYVGEDSHATLIDLQVHGTLSEEASGLFGRGLEADRGAAITLERAVLSENRGVGLIAADGETRVEATDVAIRATTPMDCAETHCIDRGGGYGVVMNRAHLGLRRFLIEDNSLCGIMLAATTDITLAGGTVARHPIGINLQGHAGDPAALVSGVELRGNDRNLDTTVLPIPEPAYPMLED